MKTPVEQLIDLIPEWSTDMEKALGYITYLQQFRNLRIGLPRRSGKTTAIKELASKYSALLISNNLSEYNGVRPYTSKEAVLADLRGRKPYGLKYRCILIDEYSPFNIEDLVTSLKLGGFLERDFFVLQLFTPK